jgi:hypothetical protein
MRFYFPNSLSPIKRPDQPGNGFFKCCSYLCIHNVQYIEYIVVCFTGYRFIILPL